MKLLGLILLLILGAGTAAAQNSDLGLLIGGADLATGARFGVQINYAWQILERPAGRLYVELPIIHPVKSRTEQNPPSIFITPGIRYHFNLKPRVAVYVAAGAGVVTRVQSGTTSKAFALGAGVDYRLTRLWSLRGDFRNPTTSAKFIYFARDNNPSTMFGVALHF